MEVTLVKNKTLLRSVDPPALKDVPAKRARSNDSSNTRDWDQWVSATATRNYLLHDPLLDWLSTHSSTLAYRRPDLGLKISKSLAQRSTDNFIEFIMAQGIEFESKIVEMLCHRLGRDMIVDVGGSRNARSIEKFNETIALMNRGVPLIYNGVLHNDDDQTYGVPDLLVRSDWFDRLVRTPPLTPEETTIPAPKLRDVLSMRGRPPNFHYRVVDIKWTTLYLRADGVRILNASSFPAYKGQLLIYNRALARVQGYEPPRTYILGRKWTYTTCGETSKGRHPLDRLGVIDYSDVDAEYIPKTDAAIRWVKEMRRDGHQWEITPHAPLSRPELYPNMSNSHDYPWHAVKVAIASQLSEITELWMCGVKNRELAHSQGIYRWRDERCTTETLGVKGPVVSKILSKILSINRDITDDLVRPDIIQGNRDGWQRSQNIEFYVDFEFLTDIFSDSSLSAPGANPTPSESTALIFMIGVGYFDPGTGWWIFKEFTVDELTQRSERKICQAFSDYIREESDFFECANPLLIHWSSAENWQWNTAYDKHDGVERAWIPTRNDGNKDVDPRWFDLLKVFREEPIVVRGALGFSLKEVARAMADHNLIEARWDENSSCTDGASAMLCAYNASKEARRRGATLKEMPQVQEIIRYNEVDCKSVGEIIRYLRDSHTLAVHEDLGDV
jgi:hypothetical protein